MLGFLSAQLSYHSRNRHMILCSAGKLQHLGSQQPEEMLGLFLRKSYASPRDGMLSLPELCLAVEASMRGATFCNSDKQTRRKERKKEKEVHRLGCARSVEHLNLSTSNISEPIDDC
jgi:hypothetical protein